MFTRIVGNFGTVLLYVLVYRENLGIKFIFEGICLSIFSLKCGGGAGQSVVKLDFDC